MRFRFQKDRDSIWRRKPLSFIYFTIWFSIISRFFSYLYILIHVILLAGNESRNSLPDDNIGIAHRFKGQMSWS